MLELLWLPVALQVVTPIGLLAWLALRRPFGYGDWLLAVAIAAGYVRAITVAGLWTTLPPFLPTLYAVLLLAGALTSFRRLSSPAARRWSRRAVAGVASRVVALGAVLALLAHASAARGEPGRPVELAFPLRGGTYLVVNGGSVQLLNTHLMTLESERFRPYRGQSYGVDLVRVNARGQRAAGFLPGDPGAYAIFGDSVVAPCAGRVVVAADGHDDMHPPQPDRGHMAGNHVVLGCGDVWVLLGHLQRGSVRVMNDDRVEVGESLGLVGNSGNSNEPHLHVHAQQPGTPGMPFSGEPLPIRLDGRYLVRNDRVTSTAPSRTIP